MAHKTEIGKDIIDLLMFKLYPEAETIYREYLQNACDSIIKAIEVGYLGRGEGSVDISIDPARGRIEIEDNGMGISSVCAESILKDIAMSPKRNESISAGQYGIGRLVGGGYCQYLKFETSYQDEDVKSEITFDINKTEQLLKSDDYKRADDIIDATTHFEIKKCSKNKHYFKVVLIGVKHEYSNILLDEDKIRDYLSQIAPVPYAPAFKKNLLDKAISFIDDKAERTKYSDYISRLNQINVTLNGKNITKKYGLHVDGTNDEIIKLRLFTLKGSSEENLGDLAWGWYAITKFTKAIDQNDVANGNKPVLTRGLRLRDHNIQIGKQGYFDGVNYFKQARSNQYFIGEIHVVNDKIMPVADRSDLAPTKETLELKNAISVFFRKELEALYQNASKVKKALERFYNAKQHFLEILEKDVSENYSKELKENDLSEAKRNYKVSIDEVNPYFARHDTNRPLDAIIDSYGNIEVLSDEIINNNDNVDSQQATKIGINKNTKKARSKNDDESFDNNETNTKVVSANGKKTKTVKVDNRRGDNSTKLNLLKGKYNTEIIKTIGKIFNILDANIHTNTDISLIEKLKTTVISEFLK